MTIERGEEHDALWGHLGIERPDDAGGRRSPYSLDDLYPDALDCLERVRALGLRVGIVGNQTEALERWAREAALPADVDLVVREPRRPQAGSARSSSSSSSSWGARRTRSPTSATASTTTSSRRAAAGLVAVHVRRGPWGRLQRTPPEAALGLDDLASLPEALASLALSELRVGIGVDAHALRGGRAARARRRCDRLPARPRGPLGRRRDRARAHRRAARRREPRRHRLALPVGRRAVPRRVVARPPVGGVPRGARGRAGSS